ncbi:MAG: hypothetical protein NZM04_05475 [Methylacidiphilales bacterium]|nr:hypothetical protein [Candidatus Methylacidiphilales bacterium]
MDETILQVIDVLSNLSPIQIVIALLFAAGILLTWAALVLPARVILIENTPENKIRQANIVQQIDAKIRDMGMDIGLEELIVRGLLIGAIPAVIFGLQNYFVAAILCLIIGVYAYYEYCVYKFEGLVLTYKEEFITTVENFKNLMSVHGNIVNAIKDMVNYSRPMLKPVFELIYSTYMSGNRAMHEILESIARSRASDSFWVSFFNTLAAAEQRGGSISGFLEDIINAARKELNILEKYSATLTETRMVGVSYALFPPVALLLVSLLFPNDPQSGLSIINPFSLTGVISQVVAMIGGGLSWYFSRRVAAAGINVYDQYQGISYDFSEEDRLL